MASDVSAAIKWIGSALIAEGKYLYGIKDLVSDLQKDLQYMQLFLQKVDANPNPVREDDALSLLTPDMTRLANRATDAIDTYRHNLQSKVNRGNWFLSGLSLGFHFYPVHKLRKEIEAIHKDTEKAKKRYEDFSKIAGTTSNLQQQAAQPNPESYLHLNNEFVVGIEDDIVDLVTKLTDLTNDFDVLGIVGTGGAGKSTLATQIYRHDRVQTWFSYKAFVSVSQQWDTVDVLSRILEQIMQHKHSLPSNEKELSEKLHAFMRGRKCLVVLDDVWTTGACDAIYTLLPHTKGIRVVITTRKEEVAKHPSTRRVIHKPKLLTDEQKLELFKKVAVDGRNDIDYDVQFSNLVSEMLAKIEGLPLAVVTLGGILRRKQDFDEWDMVNKDCSSYIINGKGGARYGSVKDMLRLSYLDLPPHMKDCFLYLGIIPEDREFSCQKIAQMWIAEGFIPNKSQMGNEALENTAMCVLLEFARHCILQVTERHPLGRVERFRVHDLIREFCIEMAKEKKFLQVVTCTSLDVTSRRRPKRYED